MKNLLIITIAMTCISCYQSSSGDRYNEIPAKVKMVESENNDLNTTYSSSTPLAYQSPPQKPDETKKTQPKQIIKTGNLELEVDGFETADTRIREVIKMIGAVIHSESQRNSSYKKGMNMTLKVNPENFDNLLHQLEKEGKTTVQKSINLKDVTEEYLDLQTRIASKEAVIKRYRDLLNKANSVTEILEIENSLRPVTEELESVKGRLRYLNDQVAQSTVHLEYYQKLERSSSYEEPSFLTQIGRAIKGGWNGLKSFVIGIFYIWPFILIGILGFIFARKLWRSKMK